MKPCDACGAPKGMIGMGGAILCRDCDPLVRAEMDALRAAGKPVNVLHIAKRMFRESNPVGGYLLRDIPADLWQQAQHRAVDEQISLRDLILKSLHDYLAKPHK